MAATVFANRVQGHVASNIMLVIYNSLCGLPNEDLVIFSSGNNKGKLKHWHLHYEIFRLRHMYLVGKGQTHALGISTEEADSA